MANQTLKDNSSSSTAIAWEKYLITADYLIENPKEIKNGWDYRRIETFLKFIVANSGIQPDFDLEKANLQEVINFIRSRPDIFSEVEEHLESVVPSPELLQKLIKDWEEAQTKFNQERAASKLIETIEKISLANKFQQIVRERLSQAVSPLIAEAIVNGLPVDSQPALALKKSEELLEAQRESAVKEIVEEAQETISMAIASLEQKMEIPLKERASLSKIQITASDLPMIASDLGRPPAQRKEIKKWLETQFTVEESQNLAEILAPAVAAKIDFIRVSEKQIEEAVTISLAENAPDLGIIPPEKISKIIAAFIPDKEELKLLLSAKEVPSLIIDEPIEVTSLPSKFQRFFAPPLQRSSPKEVLLVQDSKGKSFIEQLRQRIFTEGIDKSNALQLRSIVLESWILYLTAQNISQEDLDCTIQRLIKSGENPNSPRIRELRELREALTKFQANLPPLKVLEIKKQSKDAGQKGELPVIINSRQQTVIFRESPFNPKLNLRTRIESFWGRLSGRKLIKLDSGPTIIISRFSFYKHQLSESFKSVLFRTGLGQNLSSWLKISTQRRLQGLWNLTTSTGKQVIGQGLKTILGTAAKAIFKIAGTTIGTIATGGLGKALMLGSGLLKNGFKWLTSGFGIAGTFLGGISGGSPEEDNGLIKQILWVVVGIFIIIPVLFFIINTTTSTAFIEPTEIGPGEIPIPTMAPLQCNSPRHLAEETICKLSQGSPPCNNQKINQSTWNSTDQCFQQITLLNKQMIYDEFNSSVFGYKSLQCVGFAQGIQKALSKEIIKAVEKARDYLYEPYPPNYEFIRGEGAKPEKGDLAIWYGIKDGHIAIVVEVVGNIKIIVAQAWGDDIGQAGNIFLSESPYGGSNDGSPNGFLRPK